MLPSPVQFSQAEHELSLLEYKVNDQFTLIEDTASASPVKEVSCLLSFIGPSIYYVENFEFILFKVFSIVLIIDSIIM